MNKYHLFRGKREDTGEWVIGSLFIWREERYISPLNAPNLAKFSVIPETVGQCIGSEDKNGELVFDGDIIKIRGGGFDCAKIKWDESLCGFVADVKFDCTDINELPPFEVIGNIYDNPELWEGGAP